MGGIGFVLVTHSNQQQIRRLVARLDGIFDHPPIALHHDFGKCALDISEFPNVKLVQPHFSTRWSHISVVRATMAALRLLYTADAGPDWFCVLSGADYPVRSADAVLADLEAGECDAYVQHELLYPGKCSTHLSTCEPVIKRHAAIPITKALLENCMDRYVNFPVRVPWITRRGRRSFKFYVFRYERGVRLLSPFSDKFRCYIGQNWFTANRRAARYMLAWTDAHPEFARALQDRPCPEETYFQSILGNSGLKLSQQTFRYVDWSEGGDHPKSLDVSDVPAIEASGAHFARKFSPDSPALDLLDAGFAIDLRRSAQLRG